MICSCIRNLELIISHFGEFNRTWQNFIGHISKPVFFDRPVDLQNDFEEREIERSPVSKKKEPKKEP